MMGLMNKLIDFFFKTSDGTYVFGQTPNPPIMIAGFFWLLDKSSLFDPSILPRQGFQAALIYWAALEVLTGVNRFRKLLGLVVLSLIFTSLL